MNYAVLVAVGIAGITLGMYIARRNPPSLKAPARRSATAGFIAKSLGIAVFLSHVFHLYSRMRERLPVYGNNY